MIFHDFCRGVPREGALGKASRLIFSLLLVFAAMASGCKRSSEPGGRGARKSEPAPVKEDFQLAGENVASEHSRFDMGRIQDLFDNDDATLARMSFCFRVETQRSVAQQCGVLRADQIAYLIFSDVLVVPFFSFG